MGPTGEAFCFSWSKDDLLKSFKRSTSWPDMDHDYIAMKRDRTYSDPATTREILEAVGSTRLFHLHNDRDSQALLLPYFSDSLAKAPPPAPRSLRSAKISDF